MGAKSEQQKTNVCTYTYICMARHGVKMRGGRLLKCNANQSTNIKSYINC